MSCEEYQVAGLLGPLECYPTKGDCVIIDCALCRIKELEAEVKALRDVLGKMLSVYSESRIPYAERQEAKALLQDKKG